MRFRVEAGKKDFLDVILLFFRLESSPDPTKWCEGHSSRILLQPLYPRNPATLPTRGRSPRGKGSFFNTQLVEYKGAS